MTCIIFILIFVANYTPMKKIYILFLFSFLLLRYIHAKPALKLHLGDIPNVQEIDNPIKILAYPNPTKDRLFVESDQSITSISIYNLLGQKLKSFILDGTKRYEFSVSDLPAGTYVVTVQSGNQTVNQKFTKID